MKNIFKLIWIGIPVIVVALGIIWYAGSRDRSLSSLRQKGMIRIGYAVEAPYAFLLPDGTLTGESPEVVRKITEQLGIGQIEWVQTEFGSLISDLNANRFDVIAAGMFITPERAELVNFSEPTFHVQQGLLVLKGNPHQLHAYQQMAAQKDIKVAVLSGSVEEALFRQLGVFADQLVVVPDALTGRSAVEFGLADGLALSTISIHWMAVRDQLGRTEMADPFEQPEQVVNARLGYGAFVFRKTDRQLLAAWNAALKVFIGSPQHQALVAAFGFTAAELPGNITTQEVLSRQ